MVTSEERVHFTEIIKEIVRTSDVVIKNGHFSEDVMTRIIEKLIQEGCTEWYATAFAEGFAEGFEEGMLSVLIDVVKRGIITVEEAAEDMDMSVDDFKMKIGLTIH